MALNKYPRVMCLESSMKALVATALAVLAACATPRSVAPTPVSAPPLTAPPVSTFAGQRDLDALASFFTGTWDSRPGALPMRLRVASFWPGSPVRWFYLEWVDPGAEAPPRRQVVLRVAEAANGALSATLHRLPGEASRHAGEWREARPFAGLSPADLPHDEACRLKVARAMTAHFTLVTAGTRCPGDIPGAPYMRFEFSLTSSELEVLEQPRDAAGNVPPRSRLNPYYFGRSSRDPR